MKPERHRELSINQDLSLTEGEISEGWFFCLFEWDGMLVKAGDPEADICESLCNCRDHEFYRLDKE